MKQKEFVRPTCRADSKPRYTHANGANVHTRLETFAQLEYSPVCQIGFSKSPASVDLQDRCVCNVGDGFASLLGLGFVYLRLSLSYSVPKIYLGICFQYAIGLCSLFSS